MSAPAPLPTKARAALRARAHALKPVLHVGKEGLTPALIHAVSDALRTRDLVKLKVLETAPEDARTFAATLAAAMEDLSVVQVMGRIVTLHRPLPPSAVKPKPAATPKPDAPAKPKRAPATTRG